MDHEKWRKIKSGNFSSETTSIACGWDLNILWRHFYGLEVTYRTRRTVFNHISKHRQESWKYDAEYFWRTSRYYEICLSAVLRIWYIFSIETKKLMRKRRNEIVKSKNSHGRDFLLFNVMNYLGVREDHGKMASI